MYFFLFQVDGIGVGKPGLSEAVNKKCPAGCGALQFFC